MKICNDNKCSACELCAQLCSKNAIEFCVDDYGFRFPKINENRCVNCGICIKECPQNSEDKSNNILKTYVGYSTDLDLLKKSTSGGIVGELYKEIIHRNGYIAGVRWENVKEAGFFLSNTQESILGYHGSKYIGARINNIYITIKEKLDQNNLVLFVGTPCQCAALKRYLKKEYENLYLVDFICHGVSSELVLDRYIDYWEKDNKKIRTYIMRSKENGYSQKNQKIVYNDGNLKIENFYSSTFGFPFASGISLRESCFSCKYASKNRVSDITVGDWMEMLTEEEKENGASLVVVNTVRGGELLEQIVCDKRIDLKEIPEKMALERAYRLSHKSPVPKLRKAYLQALKSNNNSIDVLTRKFMKKSQNTLIRRLYRIKKIFLNMGGGNS